MMSSLLQASLDMDLVHVGESSLDYVGIVNVQLQSTCQNDFDSLPEVLEFYLFDAKTQNMVILSRSSEADRI